MNEPDWIARVIEEAAAIRPTDGEQGTIHVTGAELRRIISIHVHAITDEEVGAAINTVGQSLGEVSHAQAVGAGWYTKGDSGLYQQVRMHLDRGFKAIAVLRGAYRQQEPLK